MLFADFKFHAMVWVEVTSCLLDIGSIKSPRCIISTFFFLLLRDVESKFLPDLPNVIATSVSSFTHYYIV